ncbi:MAG: hypothetical protein CH6_1851 [Candidatus Kapaibacterium sp.]|nr:MAG: hypothetical protein CH6_1851 [Candidatus Kapabacteria bacterium]
MQGSGTGSWLYNLTANNPTKSRVAKNRLVLIIIFFISTPLTFLKQKY